MGRWSKRLKKYERSILLGLVILLLVSFSVAGAIQCSPGGASEAPDYGGSFLVTPAQRGELSNEEFMALWRRYVPFLQSVGTPSLTWQPGWFRIRPELGDRGAWLHALMVEAAKKQGYHCGDEQLKAEIRDVVQGVMGGLEPTDATYDLFLRENYRYGVEEFQDTVREMVIKDAFLRPLIDTPRYGVSYEEAYEQWKRLLQRVDLGYVALHSDDFNLQALQQERTRERVGEQLQILRDLATTGDALLTLEKILADESAEIPTRADAWENDIRAERGAEGALLTSAGPDGEFGTADDVTLDTIAELRTRAALRKIGTGLTRWHGSLQPIVATQASLQEIKAALDTWRETREGTWPASLAEVYGESEQQEPRDAWERRFRFRVEEDAPIVVSAGPDGLYENDDDVTLAGERFDSPWPASLSDLVKAPWPGTLPPLTGDLPQDGWTRDVVYEPAGEGAPRLYSTGPDGEPGTPDDVQAIVNADGSVRMPLAGVLVAFLAEEENDAWDRPVRVELADAILDDLATWRWTAVSAGADGAFDTDDDLKGGNEGELRALFRDLRGEFTHPLTRKYEALWVHMPLVPDEALRTLVAAHPDLAPDEASAFKTWRRLYKDTIYLADDPADAENGHGIELAERLSPGGTHTLVPDASIFGEVPEGLIPEDETDLQDYVTKGWRGILLRESFFTNLFERLLTRARESRQAHEDWKAKKAAYEEKPDEAEDPGEEPTVEEFDALLADALGDVSAARADDDIAWIGVYRSEKPLELSDWEANEHIGDMSLTLNTQTLTAPGALAPMVLSLHENQTRALVRNLEYSPMRAKEFEEVYDEIWDRYIDRKSMDLAVARLDDLRRAYVDSGKQGADEPEAALAPPAERWEKALAAWAKDLGDTPYVADRTGWFIGARPPRPIEDYDAFEPDEMVRQLRSSFVRQAGFPTIEASLPEGGEMVAGTLGTTVLRDEGSPGSSSAYLVRLVDAKDPPRAAFSPRDYSDFLMAEILGGPKGGRSLGAAAGREVVEGTLPQLMRRYFADFPWMQKAFELETRMPMEAPQR